MSAVRNKLVVRWMTRSAAASLLALNLALIAPPSLHAKKKKEIAPAEPANPTYQDNRKFWEHLDTSKFVWPGPPAIARIKYLTFWSGEKFVEGPQEKKKSSWMERVSGIATGENANTNKPRWQLVVPNGVAVDSKGRVYIADSKVRSIFIVNPETGAYDMLKNGTHAKFQWLTGLAIDDSDRIFAADSGLRRVLIFDANHKAEASIGEGLVAPGGIAIDNENRFLYVTDAEQDLVLVYDADPPYKLIRKLGKPGTKHASTATGEFAKPAGVAVDKEGNVFVSDTWNNRIQVFDADGVFIRAFGKAGDGPGYFARPKGLAVDTDGHVWVADAVQDRLQVFTPEGRLLIYIGGHGLLPGKFQSLANVTIDKNNRVFTTEQMPGRMQVFHYTPDADAKAEYERRNAEGKKKAEEKRSANTGAPDSAQSAAPAKN